MKETTMNLLKSFGFILLMMGVVVYVAFTDADIVWSGFISMLLFYALIYYIGAFMASKKTGSLDDMMVARRSMPLGVAMFTMSATWVGGGFINGTAESTYADGLVWAQAPWGYALSLIIGGIFYARKMRRYEFMTIIDPLEQRFGKKMAGILYIPALLGELFWSGAILTALGTTFGTILGLDFTTSIIISAVIAVAYTVFGGMWAVAYTDVFQNGRIDYRSVSYSSLCFWQHRQHWRKLGELPGRFRLLCQPVPSIGWMEPSGLGQLVLALVGLCTASYFRRNCLAGVFSTSPFC